MKISNVPSPLRATDYEAIEAALLETARGRWFLCEYSKRNRRADTNVLLEAIGKLGATVSGPQVQEDNPAIRAALKEMLQTISRARKEIAEMRAGDGDDSEPAAPDELDAIIKAAATATSDILEAAEDIKDFAWLMREKGLGEEACNCLDARANKIDTACSVHALAGECMSEAIKTLHLLEARVHAIIEMCGFDDIVAGERPNSQIQLPDPNGLGEPAADEAAGPEAARNGDGTPAAARTHLPDAALAASSQVRKAVKEFIADGVDDDELAKPRELDAAGFEDVQEPALFT